MTFNCRSIFSGSIVLIANICLVKSVDLSISKIRKNSTDFSNVADVISFINKLSVLEESDAEYNWSRYHTLNETYDWLYSLSKDFPDQASLFVAGKSFEGRNLLGIKISYGDDDNRKAIFLEGGIHAREWISSATTTFIAYHLLTSNREDVRMVAENFDWYILPHVNPDGYVYSHTTDRLWRKSRSLQANDCYGVDLNRNWNFHWNEKGSSNDSCSAGYAGPAPFSEIETRTLSKFIDRLKSKIMLYVALHSYRHKLLYPYGYTSELPPNHADLKRVYEAGIRGLMERYGNKYTGGSIHGGLYPASGNSIDWVYVIAGVKYAYVYELCPLYSQWYGFELPAKFIVPTAQETLDSLVEMVKEIAISEVRLLPDVGNGGQQIKTILSYAMFILFLLIKQSKVFQSLNIGFGVPYGISYPNL